MQYELDGVEGWKDGYQVLRIMLDGGAMGDGGNEVEFKIIWHLSVRPSDLSPR